MTTEPNVRHFSFVNEASAHGGTIRSAVDSRGVIRVAAQGFWSVKQATDHFNQLSASVRDLHGRGIKVSVIVDLRGADAQGQDVAKLLSEDGTGIYRAGDKVAMVVPSSLVKLQLRRVVEVEFHQFFLTLEEAEAWALADRLD